MNMNMNDIDINSGYKRIYSNEYIKINKSKQYKHYVVTFFLEDVFENINNKDIQYLQVNHILEEPDTEYKSSSPLSIFHINKDIQREKKSLFINTCEHTNKQHIIHLLKLHIIFKSFDYCNIFSDNIHSWFLEQLYYKPVYFKQIQRFQEDNLLFVNKSAYMNYLEGKQFLFDLHYIDNISYFIKALECEYKETRDNIDINDLLDIIRNIFIDIGNQCLYLYEQHYVFTKISAKDIFKIHNKYTILNIKHLTRIMDNDNEKSSLSLLSTIWMEELANINIHILSSYYHGSKETCLEHLNMLSPSLHAMFMNCLCEPEKRNFVLDIIYQTNHVIHDLKRENKNKNKNKNALTTYKYKPQNNIDYIMNII